jgi:DNA-binding CsgD family transcriptional regulator
MPAEIAKMVDGYREGLTVYRLAEEFRINRGTVAGLLKRSGVTMRNQTLTAAQIELATEMYREGLSLMRVAKQIGCSHSTIWYALRTAGVRLRKRPGW